MKNSNLAFHGDEKLAAAMVAEVQWHHDQDKLVQESYHLGGRFCFIGCAVRSYEKTQKADVDRKYRNLGDVARGFNFDYCLTRICENIFESLPGTEAFAFTPAVAHAAKLGMERGVNVHLVQWKFLHWLADHVLENEAFAEIRHKNSQTLSVLARLAEGIEVDATEKEEAYEASIIRALQFEVSLIQSALAARAVARVAEACRNVHLVYSATIALSMCGTGDEAKALTEQAAKIIQLLEGE